MWTDLSPLFGMVAECKGKGKEEKADFLIWWEFGA